MPNLNSYCGDNDHRHRGRLAYSLEETLDISEQDTASVFGAAQPLKVAAVCFPEHRQVFTRLHGVTSQKTAVFNFQLFYLSL